MKTHWTLQRPGAWSHQVRSSLPCTCPSPAASACAECDARGLCCCERGEGTNRLFSLRRMLRLSWLGRKRSRWCQLAWCWDVVGACMRWRCLCPYPLSCSSSSYDAQPQTIGGTCRSSHFLFTMRAFVQSNVRESQDKYPFPTTLATVVRVTFGCRCLLRWGGGAYLQMAVREGAEHPCVGRHVFASSEHGTRRVVRYSFLKQDHNWSCRASALTWPLAARLHHLANILPHPACQAAGP